MGITLYYLIVVTSSALFCIGLITFLNRPFFKLATSSTSQINVIIDKYLKEEEKDKQILQTLIKVLGYLLSCLIILCLLVIGAALLPVLYIQLYGEIEADTSSAYFYSSMIVGSFSLFFFKKKGNYSYWSRLLHTIVLDNYALGRYLLEKEFRKNPAAEPTADHDFIIITGLARSGTTALTNLIFDVDKFHSVRYSNVPFLLSPNLWKKVYNPKRVKERERAHQDKVLFSETSIEALEEYFFKAQLNDSYIDDHSLIKHSISNDLLIKYYKYQDLFKKKDTTTYFAKNNNFLLRYESIRQRNKRFNVLLIFRNPLDHAKSLLRQHRNFVDQQKDDDFTLSYMNWLGHHEFGLNHKHFDLYENNNYSENAAKNELSFWLQVWVNYYSYVTEIYDPTQNLFLIHYDDLANNPNGLKKTIGMKIKKELKTDFVEPFEQNKPTSQNIIDVNDKHLKKAEEIYCKLLSDKIKVTEYNNI